MPFMERLQSAMILKTPMHHDHEVHLVENLHAPFFEAIKNNDIDRIALMIHKGFDVDFHNTTVIAPLIFAVMHRRNTIVSYLLEHGANVNVTTSKQENALHLAIKLRQYDIMTLLLRYGADAHQKNSEQISPYEMTLNNPLARELIETTSMIPVTSTSCFESAKKANLYDLVHTGRNHDMLFKTTPQGHSLLHLAIYGGNLKMITYLLNKGLNIDALDNSGNTPLNTAVKFAHYSEIVKLLIERNATLDHRNAQGRTPLTAALRNGYDTIASLLIQNGANIHTVDGIDTPLTLTHEAITKFPDRSDAFRQIETELMIRGAHLEIPLNHLRWTPLFLTVSKVQDHAVRLHLETLIKMGAHLDYRDTNGRTPLMIAASLGRRYAVETLVNNYASINMIDNFGWSALMLAVYYNHYKIVQFLLETGADVNLSSTNHLNALKIARDHKRNQIINLLLEFGATEEENSE